MAKRKLVLHFPPDLINEPLTYRLVKDFDLAINILSARVEPQEEGRLVVGVEGESAQIERGISYLKELGVRIQPLVQDIRWNPDRCTHCTMCVPLCPAQAFVLDRTTMEVTLDRDSCIACGLCARVCPYRAIDLLLG